MASQRLNLQLCTQPPEPWRGRFSRKPASPLPTLRGRRCAARAVLLLPRIAGKNSEPVEFGRVVPAYQKARFSRGGLFQFYEKMRAWFAEVRVPARADQCDGRSLAGCVCLHWPWSCRDRGGDCRGRMMPAVFASEHGLIKRGTTGQNTTIGSNAHAESADDEISRSENFTGIVRIDPLKAFRSAVSGCLDERSGTFAMHTIERLRYCHKHDPSLLIWGRAAGIDKRRIQNAALVSGSYALHQLQ